MEIQVKRESSVHNGGTKYYQIYTITGDINCTVFNWGKMPRGGTKVPNARTGSSTFDSFPYSDDAVRHRTSQFNAKKKRDYDKWGVESFTYHNLGDFKLFLAAQFPKTIQDKFLDALSGVATAEAVPEAEEHSKPPGTRAKKPAPPKPEYVASSADPNWGQW